MNPLLPLLLLLLASLAFATTANTDTVATNANLCSELDFLANDLGDDSCRGALKMNPRPTTYNACVRGREKGFRDACIQLSKPNSFAACNGSTNKKRRPNNPFARCRRAYEVAFEETQRGIVERVREIAAEATVVVEDVAEESVVSGNDSQQPPITEDVVLRQLEESEPEEDRPTPYQAPPTDVVTEGAIETEDTAAIESVTSTAEVAEEDKGSAAHDEESAAPEEEEAVKEHLSHEEGIVDEPLGEGPGVSETSANGPTGPADSKSPPTEAENVLGSSPPGIDGSQEFVSGDLNDDEVTTVDATASTRNHVSLDSEKTPIVDL
jgi:hypothetical protein